MAFEQVGIVHKVFATESKTESFQAREFVIKTDGQYPQFIKFQLTQDRCDLVEGCKEGDKLKVSFDLRGREWNEKYFTNLNAWKIEKMTADVPQNQPPAPGENFAPMDEPPNFSNTTSNAKVEDFEDLPF